MKKASQVQVIGDKKFSNLHNFSSLVSFSSWKSLLKISQRIIDTGELNDSCDVDSDEIYNHLSTENEMRFESSSHDGYDGDSDSDFIYNNKRIFQSFKFIDLHLLFIDSEDKLIDEDKDVSSSKKTPLLVYPQILLLLIDLMSKDEDQDNESSTNITNEATDKEDRIKNDLLLMFLSFTKSLLQRNQNIDILSNEIDLVSSCLHHFKNILHLKDLIWKGKLKAHQDQNQKIDPFRVT